jgi:hypothetical protein
MLLQFLSFVQLHCHGMEPAFAASEALKQWMELRDRGETGETEPEPGGYRWKTLFLPEGARLQVDGRNDAGFAYVVRGQLVWHGEATTPNRFARMALGYQCNAWRHIWITMPWDTRPVLASVVRRDPLSPARVAMPPKAPDVVHRATFGSLLPRGRLSLLTYPRIWPDFERREARHERRMGAERRVVDALWEE